MNRRIGRPNREPGPVSRETEEWVAAITGQSLPTPEAERELNEWVADITGQPVRSAQDEQELNEWLADISTRHEHLRRNEQSAQEWDSDLHPRLGGPPNAGWFAPKDGGVTGSSSGTHGGYRSPDAQKVTSSGADLSRAGNTTDRHGPDAHRARDQRDNLLQFQQPGQQRNPRVIRPGQQPGQVTPGGQQPGMQGQQPAANAQPAQQPAQAKPRNAFGKWEGRLATYPAEGGTKDNGMIGSNPSKVRGAIEELRKKEVGRVFEENKVVYSLDRNESAANNEITGRGGDPLDPNAEGVYDSRTGVIHVFGERTDRALRNDSDHTTYHEAGHAVDHHLGDQSRSPEFRAALAKDRSEAIASGSIRPNEKYYLNDPQEAYAEAFARTTDWKYENRPGKLPNTVEYMKRNRDVQALLRPRQDKRLRR